MSEQKQIENYFNDGIIGLNKLEKFINMYWGKITFDFFIPNLINIYNKLVELKATRKKPIIWGDANGYLYYIPDKRKVIILETRNENFIFILRPKKIWHYVDGGKDKEVKIHNLHIRRFWKSYNDKSDFETDELKNAKKSIKSMINSASILNRFSDDFDKYPHRPSLKMYEKAKFNLDNSGPIFFGDFRDSGFILSYNPELFFENQEILGSKNSFYYLELMYSVYIRDMVYTLNLELFENN